MKATAMDILDLELIAGRCYSFRYPNFEDGLDYRRFRFEGTAYRDSGVYLVGVDLNTGTEGKWSPDLVQRLEEIPEPVLVPHRAYTIRHQGKPASLFVYSCFPDEGDFKVTGRANGQFFAGWLSEIEAVESRKGVRNEC